MALEPTDLNKLQRLAQAVANGAQAMMDAAESILRYEHWSAHWAPPRIEMATASTPGVPRASIVYCGENRIIYVNGHEIATLTKGEFEALKDEIASLFDLAPRTLDDERAGILLAAEDAKLMDVLLDLKHVSLNNRALPGLIKWFEGYMARTAERNRTRQQAIHILRRAHVDHMPKNLHCPCDRCRVVRMLESA